MALAVGMSLVSEGPTQFTGTGRYVRELLAELAKRPAEVTVEVLAGGGARGARSPAGRAAALAVAAARPRRLSRSFSADTQVVHYPLTLCIPRAPGLPTVQTLFDLQHHDLPTNFSRAQRAWRRVTYDRAAQRVTCVVTISDHSRRRALECVPLDPERVFAVPLGVDTALFSPEPGPDDERALAPLDLPERFLLYPATLWPHKNHNRLLEALARVADRSLGLALTGATMGRLGALTELSRRLGLEGRVHHLGRVPEGALPALYRRATALVFPSLHEGFGMPPLEAMASGCPVASSRETALAEVCGSAAATLEPLDPAQMAEAIEAVAGDEQLRGRLRADGLERARRFTWARTAEGHLDVFRRARELHGG